MTIIFRKRGIDNSNFQGKSAFIARVREVMQIARDNVKGFYMEDSELPIVFFNTGVVAGYAKCEYRFAKRLYNVEFNTVAIDGNYDSMITDTIPHEIAHIVDMYVNGRSSGHGPRWQRIAKLLGCSAKRCHNYDMTDARRTRKRAIYIATCGTEVKVSVQMHNKIQNGQNRILRSTRGTLGRTEFTGKVVTI